MNPRIVIQSVVGAAYFSSPAPWACISIVTQEDTWPALSEANRVGLLRLAFADIDEPASGRGASCFQESQAEEILDFVACWWARIDRLLIHCEEGMSRSPAVAAAITKIYGGDDSLYFRPYMFRPNRFVYRAILAAAKRRGQDIQNSRRGCNGQKN